MPAVPDIAALIVAVSFAAGLNVYLTVATLGVLARLQWIELPGELGMVANWAVIGASAALFLIEFIADKIPVVDVIWNALHTFVRVPVAGVLAWAATPALGPEWQFAAAAMGSTVALAAHGGKTAARAAVTPSPEPFSNIALSLAEDAFTIFLLWFAAEHPFIAAAIALALVVVVVVLIRWVFFALRALFRSAARSDTRDVQLPRSSV